MLERTGEIRHYCSRLSQSGAPVSVEQLDGGPLIRREFIWGEVAREEEIDVCPYCEYKYNPKARQPK